MAIETRGVEETKAAFARLGAAVDDAAPRAANDVMDRLVRQARVQLSRGQHAPQTWTGSAPGESPWRVSGHLRDSVHKTPARRTGASRWTGAAGSGAVYARIQEKGGTIFAKSRMLHWVIGGVDHFARSVHLPARPYFKPAWLIVKPAATKMFRSAWALATHQALR